MLPTAFFGIDKISTKEGLINMIPWSPAVYEYKVEYAGNKDNL
jgi:hypothetical protein